MASPVYWCKSCDVQGKGTGPCWCCGSSNVDTAGDQRAGAPNADYRAPTAVTPIPEGSQ